MNRVHFSICTAAVLTAMSFAQTSAETQAAGSVSQSSSVQADRSGAQASSQTNAQAATQSAVSSQHGSPAAAASASNQLAAGSSVHATLVKPVDARKNKPGDEVVAKTTENMKSNGEVTIPKGSKLIGHVTEAKARTKDESESTMGIAFDRAVLKDGREVPMTASIQAIARAEQNTSSDLGEDSLATQGTATGMATGRAAAAPVGLVGGAGRTVGATGGTLVNTAGSVGHTAGGTLNGAASASSSLSSASHGVSGLSGLSLNTAAATTAQGSVISSTTQNVHLDSGTQMILQVTGK